MFNLLNLHLNKQESVYVAFYILCYVLIAIWFYVEENNDY